MYIPIISNFECYHSFLTEFFKENKKRNSILNHNYFSIKLDWPASYINDVLKKRKTLSLRRVLELAKLLGLDVLDTQRLIYLSFKESDNEYVKSFFSDLVNASNTFKEEDGQLHKSSFKEDGEFLSVGYSLTYLALQKLGRLPREGELEKKLITLSDVEKNKIPYYIKVLIERKLVSLSEGDKLIFPKKHIYMKDEGDLNKAFSSFYKNSCRYLEKTKKIGDKDSFDTGVLAIPNDKIDEIRAKVRSNRVWLVQISNEILDNPHSNKQDYKIYQYDLNLFPVMEDLDNC